MILLSSPVRAHAQKYLRHANTSAPSGITIEDEDSVSAPPLGIPSEDQIITDSLEFHREMGERNQAMSRRSK